MQLHSFIHNRRSDLSALILEPVSGLPSTARLPAGANFSHLPRNAGGPSAPILGKKPPPEDSYAIAADRFQNLVRQVPPTKPIL